MDELGTLKDVALRKVWDREDQHFTPWLSEHLDLLGDAIGMGLKLIKIEAQVGSYYADILAHAADDESHLVLIENQLEESDHRHLGQIMTYLGGRDARTVVWVAASFTGEHLSAIKWLNEHTHEGCSFFAVRVRAARIDQSRPAPLFEVVECPNAWERQQRHEVRTGLSESGKRYQRFWQYVIDRDAESWRGISPVATATIRWRDEMYPIMKRLHVSLVLYTNSVGVYIIGRRGEEVSGDLELWAERLSELLGVEMHIKRDYYFLQTERFEDTADESQWPELARWLTEKLNLYRDAIAEISATPPDG